MSKLCDRSAGGSRFWVVPGLEGVECLQVWSLRQRFARHSHEGYAIGVIDRGVGGNHYRGSTIYSPADSLAVFNPGEVHTGFPAGDEQLSYRMLYVPPETFQRCLPEVSPPVLFPEACIASPAWASRFRELHHLLSVRGELLEQQSRLVEQLGLFARTFGRPGGAAASGRETRVVRLIKGYLRANLSTRISIDDLAGLAGFDRAYLIRSFRRETGIPPYAYLVQLRIERAKGLLANGMPVARVAAEVGLVDQSHLHRHFRRITGATPGQYRAGHYHPRR